MDISALSTDLAQSKLMESVGAAMLGKGLSLAKEEVQGLMKLMESSALATAPLREGSGGTIDILA
jgi:hypothetical protein